MRLTFALMLRLNGMLTASLLFKYYNFISAVIRKLRGSAGITPGPG
jgi:hypothetical protein